jgi:DNA-binding response OmpR family regulator
MTRQDSGPRGRVLVVDDDGAILRSLDRGLRVSGFAVRLAPTGEDALARHAADPADVIVLDVSLPGASGTEVCAELRAGGDDVPVLMLSALDETADRIAGLQAGGDDYLVKPFALEELVLRLDALLRRRPPAPPGERPAACGVVLRPDAREARIHGRQLALTRREYDLLDVLVRNAGLVLTRDQLLDRVWGYAPDVRTDVVDTFVSYLRRKLEADGSPRVLHTVRGVGFVLRDGDRHTARETGRGGGAA